MSVRSFTEKNSLTRLAQGVAIGSVATMVIGFTWGGWVRGEKAKELAQQTASSAVIAALVPICVDRFQQASAAPSNLVELKKANSWEQSTYIEKGGWADIPGRNGPAIPGVSQACANALRDVK